jgi:hypothetical protein
VCEVVHSLQFSAEVKNQWSYTSTTHIHLCGIYRDNVLSLFYVLTTFENTLLLYELKVSSICYTFIEFILYITYRHDTIVTDIKHWCCCPSLCIIKTHSDYDDDNNNSSCNKNIRGLFELISFIKGKKLKQWDLQYDQNLCM